MFVRLWFAALVVAAGLAGCAEIPRTELGAYTKAFDTAKASSEQVMLDLSAAKKKIDDFESRRAASAASATTASASIAAGAYVPSVQRMALAKADGITARLSAFEVVDKYNSVLVTLASGKSVEAVKSSAANLLTAAGRLASAAGAAVPGLSAAAGLIRTAAAAAEKYRAREEFARLVRDGGPQMREILAFLIEDTVQIVNVHEGIWVAEMAPLRLRASNAVREISALARGRDAPVDQAGKDAVAAIERTVQGVSGRRYSIFGATSAGAMAADRALISQMEIKAGDAVGYYRALDDAAKRSPALRRLMDRYTELLGAAGDAMADLEKAIDAPVDPSASVLRLLDTAMALKRDYAAFRASL